MNTQPIPVLSIRDLSKTYPQPGAKPLTALDGATLDVMPGHFVALVGPSGSGKSTLLHCAAGLDKPTRGISVLAGQNLTNLSGSRRSAFRARHAGFIFQDYNLISSLSAADNVALPARLAGQRLAHADVKATLSRVGLAHRARMKPAQLSGGERQRVAVARVLAHRPAVVFADEPTGALDIESARNVLQWLRELPRQGTAVIMVTHDPQAAALADTVVVMGRGRIRTSLPGGDYRAVSQAVLSAQEA